MGTRARYFFITYRYGVHNFFINRSVSENFQWEIFSGQMPTESLGTQDSGKIKKNYPVLVARSRVSATKCGPLAKIRGVEKVYLLKFLKMSVTTQITSSHSLWEQVICVGKLNFEDFGRYTFFNTANIRFFC